MRNLQVLQKSETAAEELRIAYGVVYLPDTPDTEEDFTSEIEIRKSAHDLLRNGNTRCIDIEHDGNVVSSCAIVESFIVRKGDPDFPVPGSWVIGVHIPDDALWAKVKKGDLNGFSFEALARVTRNKRPVMRVQKGAAILSGRTHPADEHTHEFHVELNASGKVVGGYTTPYRDPKTGIEHTHTITRSIVTDTHGEHRHRFHTIGAA